MVLTPLVRYVAQVAPGHIETLTKRFADEAERLQLDLTEFQEQARLPYCLALATLEQATTLLEDMALPVRASRALEAGDYELLEYVFQSSPDLRTGLQCLAQYYSLIAPADAQLHAPTPTHHELRLRLTPGLPGPERMHEGLVTALLQMMRLPPQAQPSAIHFPHPAPTYQQSLQDLCPQPVRFEQEHAALVFQTAALDQALPQADSGLHRLLLRVADLELEGLHSPESFPAQVQQAIRATLDQGAPFLAVATRLNLRPTTLRTRLRQYGCSYSALVDQCRRTQAKQALRQSPQNVAAVAQALGFAHPPAFNRAFKRWFGRSPLAYRDGEQASPTERLLQQATRAPNT